MSAAMARLSLLLLLSFSSTLEGSSERPALPNPPCFTASGQPGRCMSFRACYPYYKSKQHQASWGIVGANDVCSYFGDQVGQPDVFQTFGVCCTSPVVTPQPDKDRHVPPNWPPTHPPLPTHPPDHSAPTHAPGFGIPTHPTTSAAITTTTATTAGQSTTWGTKPTTAHPVATNAPVLADPGAFGSCGIKNGYQDQERIVGGHNAEPNEWPWIVSLFNGGRQFCGASLISDQYLLSAAHCVFSMTAYDVARLTARLGDHDIRSNAETAHVERRVIRVVRHRGFDMRTLYNDVSVLKMDSPVKFSKTIRPICLPTPSQHSYGGKTATVVGWGSLREAGPQPSILQEVSIPIWNNQDCAVKYGPAAPGGIVEHMLCAGRATKDSCSGDSGGPLMVNMDGKWVQVGIVSWGIGCGKGQYPGVYSRVTAFLQWINKNSK